MIYFSGKRRRSSLFSSLTSLASVAFVSAIGNQPDVDRVSSSSSSEDEDDSPSPPKRLPWLESVGSSEASNPVSFTLTPETDETPVTAGIDNEVFKYDDETIAKFGSKDIAKATQTITDTQTNTVRILVPNPFKPNGISHSYQMDKSISVLSVADWHWSLLFKF